MLAARALPGTAQAQVGEVASTIFGYDALIVRMSDTARECDMPFPAVFERYVRNQMAQLGVVEIDETDLELVLDIDAMLWGQNKAYCSYRIELNFVTNVTSADISEDRPDLRAALDHMGSLRASVYARSVMTTHMRATVWPSGVGRNTSEDDHIKGVVDVLIARFRADRGAPEGPESRQRGR